MKIDKYESVVENGEVAFYAIAGKKRIKMPDVFKPMYTDDYLFIEETTVAMPEVFGMTENTFYIPRRTAL